MNIPKYVVTSHEYAPGCFSAHIIREAAGAEREMRAAFGNSGLYISPLRYADPLPSRDSEEYGDFYMDFDSEVPETAMLECLKTARYFLDDLQMDEQHLQVYYSGSKGYHLVVNAGALGVTPTPYLRSIYKAVAFTLKERLSLDTLDMTVYSFGRLLRVPNSKHRKTGRYKIWLPIHTLTRRTHHYIEQLAASQGALPPRFLATKSPDPEHLKFFAEAQKAYNAPPAGPSRPFELLPSELIESLPRSAPVCVEDILSRFIISGRRHDAQARVIAYFKSAGVNEAEALEILMERVRGNYPPSRHEEVRLKIQTAIRTIYSSSEYAFSCMFALSLTKYEPHANKVTCAGPACPLYEICGKGVQREVAFTKKSLF